MTDAIPSTNFTALWKLLLDVLPPDGSTLGDLSALAQLRACRADNLRAQMDTEDISGFCTSATLEEIEKNGFIITPGRSVGTAEQEEGARLDQRIARYLSWIGF